MRIIENPPRTCWSELVRRGGVDYEGIRPRVESILEQVEKEGDTALSGLMLAIDGVTAPLDVSPEEVEAACAVCGGRMANTALKSSTPIRSRALYRRLSFSLLIFEFIFFTSCSDGRAWFCRLQCRYRLQTNSK